MFFENLANITYPFLLGQRINIIALLVNWYVAIAAKHNEVVILEVAIITYLTISVFQLGRLS